MIADLKDLRVISEPTTAAIGYTAVRDLRPLFGKTDFGNGVIAMIDLLFKDLDNETPLMRLHVKM